MIEQAHENARIQKRRMEKHEKMEKMKQELNWFLRGIIDGIDKGTILKIKTSNRAYIQKWLNEYELQEELIFDERKLESEALDVARWV